MNYTTLVAAKSTDGSIRNWLNYDRIPAEIILTEAQARIYQHLRTREMRASVDLTIASGDITAPLPTGYIDPIKMTHRDNRWAFVHKMQEDLREVRFWDEDAGNYTQGTPSAFSVFNEVLNFDMRADQAYPVVFDFYKRPDALSGANETNWLTTRYPHLLRVACLRAAAEHMDAADKIERYSAQFDRIIQEVNVLDDLSLTGVDAHMEYRRG